MSIDHMMISNMANAIGEPIELAYIGPGGGLAAIGALLAVVVGLIAAVFGFIWYPFKRLLRRKNKAATTSRDGNPT